MGMRSTARRSTVAGLLAFPDDGNRYELVDAGLSVSPRTSAPACGRDTTPLSAI